jgi:hypothetical protein
MRRFGFWLGVVLLACGALAGLYELATQDAQSLGSIWFRIHANSLVGLQALIEKRISPDVWPPIQALLIWPAWLVLMTPGLALVLICWPRKPSRSSEEPA